MKNSKGEQKVMSKTDNDLTSLKGHSPKNIIDSPSCLRWFSRLSYMMGICRIEN